MAAAQWIPSTLALLLLVAAGGAYQLPCSSLVDTHAQGACLANNRPGKRERHMARMLQCSFKAEPGILIMNLLEGPSAGRLHTIANSSTISAETCEVPEGDGVWHFTRIGPFSTIGGDRWTSVQTLHDESVYSKLWHVTHEGRASLFVSDHVVGSADATGALIGYPPIHQHHWHYAHASDAFREFLSAHGDQQCLGGQGVYCLLVEYPSDVGFELVPQLNIVAEFQDVRESGSPPMEWYALGGIFVHTPMTWPKRMHWYNVALTPTNLPVGHRGTTLYDTSLESVTWATGTLPAVNYTIDSYFHAHAEMVDDLWLIAGSPAQLGLLSPPWIGAFASVKSGDGTIAALKAHLYARMSASGAYLICRYNAYPHVEAVEGYSPAHPFTRRATCPFAHQGLSGNIKWTFVGFYQRQVEGLPKMYPMHALIRIPHCLPRGPGDSQSDRYEGVPGTDDARVYCE